MRLHELASKLGTKAKDLAPFMEGLGLEFKSASQGITEDIASAVEKAFNGEADQAVAGGPRIAKRRKLTVTSIEEATQAAEQNIARQETQLDDGDTTHVFDLSRELNMLTSDLVTVLEGMGIKVKGKFQAIDKQTKAKVIAHIQANGVASVDSKTSITESSLESTEEAEQPVRRRRVISASRGGRVRKVETSETDATADSTPSATDAEAVEASTEVAQDATPEISATSTKPDSAEKTAVTAEELTTEAQPEQSEATADGETAEPQPEVEVIPQIKEKEAELLENEERRPSRPKRFAEKQTRKRPHAWTEDLADPSLDSAATQEWIKMPRAKTPKRPLRGAAKQKAIQPRRRKIRLSARSTVADLANAFGIRASKIIKTLANIDREYEQHEVVDATSVELIASEFGVDAVIAQLPSTDLLEDKEAAPQLERSPIVTIMGHVDHGKTTLLDYIRKSRVASGEFGGITQHIGAYQIETGGSVITMLDTPGHEAFTSLRIHGSNITDIVILVVAADDGVMPQTVEAIQHAQNAGVKIIVAINKIDREDANPDRIKQQLLEHNLIAEEFGGDTVFVAISALKGTGISDLIEMVQLQAEMMGLTAPVECRARAFVIESRLQHGRGTTGTLIVKQGILRRGDFFVVGETYGKIRTMQNDSGKMIKEAKPSAPVEVTGFSDLPKAGEELIAVDSEKQARSIIAAKQEQPKATEAPRLSILDSLNETAKDTLSVIIKADTQGSLDAITMSVGNKTFENALIKIVRSGIGDISETDIDLAQTTEAIVFGFNVKIGGAARQKAHEHGVKVQLNSIIYELLDGIFAELEGSLSLVTTEDIIGRGEVREVFSAPSNSQVVGVYVADGHIDSKSKVRLFRNDKLTFTGSIASLRRFKDNVDRVNSGNECGLLLEGCSSTQVGDHVEVFINQEKRPELIKNDSKST